MKWQRIENGDWQAVGEKGDFLLWRAGAVWRARYRSTDRRQAYPFSSFQKLTEAKAACERSKWWEKEMPSLTTESGEQRTIIEFCDWHKIPCIHIPNESKRSLAYGAMMKHIGLRKGFPDLFIPIAKNEFHGLFIELKRDRNSKVSDEQKSWIKYLNKAGYRAVVCYGSTEAVHEIIGYCGVKA